MIREYVLIMTEEEYKTLLTECPALAYKVRLPESAPRVTCAEYVYHLTSVCDVRTAEGEKRFHTASDSGFDEADAFIREHAPALITFRGEVSWCADHHRLGGPPRDVMADSLSEAMKNIKAEVQRLRDEGMLLLV